jgi:hypothetical protein
MVELDEPRKEFDVVLPQQADEVIDLAPIDEEGDEVEVG